MQKISQIVRLVFEIFLTEAHGICVTKGLGTGPLPDLVMKIGRNPEPTRENDSVAEGFWRYFRRKAGGPARLRSARVVQSRFILMVFH